jgi:hydrophobic/amphiphilic exporter-1 (mainly G- bacteria), HAE1 family
MRELLQQLLFRPIALSMACCVVAMGGFFAVTQLPLGLTPSLDYPALSVHMSWQGASAESVEQFLTAPVEEIAGSLRGTRKVRSTSQEGHSRVSVEFDQHSDMNFARLELNEQLAMFARQLPSGSSRPIVERHVPEDIEQLQGFLAYSLAGPLSRTALARIAAQEIIPRLMRIKGIAHVSVQGEEEEEIRVELLPERLAAADITVGDVMSALETSRPGSCNGSVPGPAGVEGINFTGNAMSLQELEIVPVRGSKCPVPVRLSDLGTAAVVSTPPRELLRANGKECLTLTITRDPNSSLPEVARVVRSCLAELAPHLPPAVELVCEMDQSRRMEEELDVLYRDALFSLFLLWATLALFLGSNRMPFVLISAVLLSIAGSFLALWILRVSLHLVTLAGLLLGLGRLLDDSIVVLENLRRWTEQGTSMETVVDGTHEVITPVIASTAATVGAMAPVLFLPREVQVYLREFAVTVAVSLSISLLVSFTVIPLAMLHWNGEEGRTVAHPRRRVASLYRWLLSKALQHRRMVLAAALWMFGVPVWLLPTRIDGPSLPAMLYNETIGGSWYAAARPVINTLFGGASYQFFRNVAHAEFLNPGTETFLIMQVDFPQGTDLVAADAVARGFEEDLLRAGAPRVTTRVFDGTLLLRVGFPDSVIATTLPRTIRSRCFHLAAQTGGATVSVAGSGEGFFGGADLQPAFTVRVLGYDYTRVRQIAESFRERLRHNPRVANADIDRSFGNWSRAQEIALLVDREAAARYGLTRQDIARAVRNRVGFLPLRTPVNLHGKQFSWVVALKGADRLSVAELGSATVREGEAAPVPFRSLLGAQQQMAPSQILREDQQYVRWVSFDYKGPYRHAQAFLDATISSFPLPEGYRFDRSDAPENSGKDRDALLLAAVEALLLVFMVTASLYESLLDPFIIMLSVPFAYIGVFMAFVLAGTPFERGGYLSVIFLTGIAVANAIVIVDFIARKAKERGNSVESIVEAAVCRLRPVLMTTLTTAGSLLPILFGERSSTLYALALGTFGGVLTSALLTLIVVPVAYAITHGVKK